MWTWLVPVLSFGVLLLAGVAGVGPLLVLVCGAALLGTVIAAVHHAEVIAHRVGEPFGTLVLALAVTVIEASLILSMMIAGGEEMATLPRDTIYAATMIICNGVVGICLLVGGLAHREGGGPRESALPPVSLGPHPDVPCRRLGRRHGRAHRHVGADARAAGVHDDDGHGYIQQVAAPVRGYDLARLCGRCSCSPRPFRTATISFRCRTRGVRRNMPSRRQRAERGSASSLLVLALVTVVGLAKMLSPSIEASGRGCRRAPRGSRNRHRNDRSAA